MSCRPLGLKPEAPNCISTRHPPRNLEPVKRVLPNEDMFIFFLSLNNLNGKIKITPSFKKNS